MLCKYILNHKSMFINKTVLELGAGLGVCGMVVAHFCKLSVITDGVDEVVNVLQNNIEKNAAKFNAKICGTKLDWGVNLEAFHNNYPNKFDLIIGSDIVFWQNSIPTLFKTVDYLLSHEPEASFLLSYQSRALQADRTLLEIADTNKFNHIQISIEEFMTPTNPHLRLIQFTRKR